VLVTWRGRYLAPQWSFHPDRASADAAAPKGHQPFSIVDLSAKPTMVVPFVVH
jgi:hypothetical protein